MKNWAPMDRRQMLVLPSLVDDLSPQNHLARFVVDAVRWTDSTSTCSWRATMPAKRIEPLPPGD